MDKNYFGKDATTLARRIYEAVVFYLESGLSLDPDVLLQINRDDHTVAIAETDEPLHNCDYYSLADLVEETADGKIQPSDDAIASLTASYVAH